MNRALGMNPTQRLEKPGDMELPGGVTQNHQLRRHPVTEETGHESARGGNSEVTLRPHPQFLQLSCPDDVIDQDAVLRNEAQLRLGHLLVLPIRSGLGVTHIVRLAGAPQL